MNPKASEAQARGEIVFYRTKDRKIELQVKLEDETIWLTQKQIAGLFGTQRPAITKHFRNIFSLKELEENSVCSILEHTAADGKVYKTAFYNLDAVISVGYRVNSARATQFRIWATQVLRNHFRMTPEGVPFTKPSLLLRSSTLIQVPLFRVHIQHFSSGRARRRGDWLPFQIENFVVRLHKVLNR